MIPNLSSFLLALILTLSLPSWAKATEAAELTDILLINSYHYTFKWTKDITDAVIAEFPEADNYRISVENMDTKRFSYESMDEEFTRYLKQKYSVLNVDGIICSDNDAFKFVLNHGLEIWGDVPVSFCGVNDLEMYDIDTTKYKGVAEEVAIKETLCLILQLQPRLEKLIVVTDSTLNGILFAKQFMRSINDMYFPTDYTMIYATSAELLGKELSKYEPENKAILLLSLYLPRNGASREMILEADFIRDCLDVPVFGGWDFLFDNFVAAGVINKGSDQGRLAAQLLKKRLQGEGEDLPFLTYPERHTVGDYQQLKRYHIDVKLLPQSARLINKPLSYFERYKTEILIVGLILGILMMVNVALLKLLTQKRLAEARLKKSESRLELALDGANAGLWDIDFVNKALFINSWVKYLLGFNDSYYVSASFDDWVNICHPEDIKQISESFAMHLSGQTPDFNSEARMLTADGTFKWFSFHGKITEKTEVGEAARMIGIMMNIDFQRQFEEQLRAAKEKAEESDRLKSSFLANMSHEIRTPMNAILGFSDILIGGKTTVDESNKYLHFIRASGESLLALINDIIDVSKIEAGQLTLNTGKFDLHKLLDKVTNTANALIRLRNIDVKFILEKELVLDTVTIEGDQFRIEQIINNLISNAIKFTSKGYIKLSYRFLKANILEIKVEDTGIGISKENHQLIFERFRQVDQEANNNTAGTGLGLAITKSVVNLMGGNISLSSELGRGAVFTVTIPCKTHYLPS